MFGSKIGMSTDFLGKGNNCYYVPRESFSSDPSMIYLLPGEIAFILLKSKKDEFLFTDQGLIFIDGESVTSPKRTVTRTNYCEGHLSNVVLITPGLADNDFSISFHLTTHWRIEMAKDELENGKIVVKCLEALSIYQKRNIQHLEMEKFARSSSNRIEFQISSGPSQNQILVDNQAANTLWANSMIERYLPLSYKSVFEGILNR